MVHNFKLIFSVFIFTFLKNKFHLRLIDDSPRWLNSVGRKDEAMKIVKKIAKINNEEINKASLIGTEVDNLIPKMHISAFFKNKVLALRLVIIVLAW